MVQQAEQQGQFCSHLMRSLPGGLYRPFHPSHPVHRANGFAGVTFLDHSRPGVKLGRRRNFVQNADCYGVGKLVLDRCESSAK